MHSLTNADSEFDFNESFWRYELSLSRPSDPSAQSPDHRLLEVRSNSISADHAQEPILRLQSFLASNSRRNSFNGLATSGQMGSGMDDPAQFGNIEMMLNLQQSESAMVPVPWLTGGLAGQGGWTQAGMDM